MISYAASAVKSQTVLRNFSIASFIGKLIVRTVVCAMVESTHFVDGLVWVRLVCRVIFGKLRHPFGSD